MQRWLQVLRTDHKTTLHWVKKSHTCEKIYIYHKNHTKKSLHIPKHSWHNKNSSLPSAEQKLYQRQWCCYQCIILCMYYQSIAQCHINKWHIYIIISHVDMNKSHVKKKHIVLGKQSRTCKKKYHQKLPPHLKKFVVQLKFLPAQRRAEALSTTMMTSSCEWKILQRDL